MREALFAAIDDARGPLRDDRARPLRGYRCARIGGTVAGASRAVFVDDDRAAVHGLKANIDACGAGAQCAVVRADATTYLRNSGGEVFDMIFCDPPYGLPDDDLDEVLRLAAELLGDGYLVLERAKRAARTRWPDTLAPILAKVYGDTRVEWAEQAQLDTAQGD